MHAPDSNRPYGLRVLIGLDQWLNIIIFNGHEDETISSKLGKSQRGDYGPTKQKLFKPLAKFVDWLFGLWGDENHCLNAIEEDEGHKLHEHDAQT